MAFPNGVAISLLILICVDVGLTFARLRSGRVRDAQLDSEMAELKSRLNEI
jgi:uncharacterized membrane-anchored protein YhcB (DUF1043 family)